MLPLVSIGMPVYNGEQYVRRALDSVLAQDYPHLEIIVSDNASTDRTRDIVLEYAGRDQRIRFVANTRNRGPWWNFHHVLQLASGECFTWAADDDFRDVNYVTALSASLAASPHAALSCPRFAKVTADGEVKSVRPFPSDLPARRVSRTILLIKLAHAAWIYGLFRTGALRRAFDRLPSAPSPWGLDYLLILPFLLDEQLVGTNDTTLYLAKTGVSASLYKPSGIVATARLQALLLGGGFSILGRSSLSPPEKLQLAPFLAWYVEKHVFRLNEHSAARGGLQAARLIRRAWRKLLGS